MLAAASALLFIALVPIRPDVAPSGSAPWELLAVRLNALRFHLALMACSSTLLLFVLRCPRLGLLGALAVLWAFAPIWATSTASRAAAPRTPGLRVLSINLAKEAADTDRVIKEILDEGADVVVFQEDTPARQRVLLRRLEPAYPYYVARPRKDAFGMAVFARVPIRNTASFHLGEIPLPQFRVELTLGTTEVALYGIHLVPILGSLYPAHRRAFCDLVARLDAEPLRPVLVGDFNFVDHGALAEALRERGFLDAHALAGDGRGATWPVNGWLYRVPGLRIDHVYVGAGLTATAAWVGARNGSDHLPVGAELALSTSP